MIRQGCKPYMRFLVDRRYAGFASSSWQYAKRGTKLDMTAKKTLIRRRMTHCAVLGVEFLSLFIFVHTKYAGGVHVDTGATANFNMSHITSNTAEVCTYIYIYLNKPNKRSSEPTNEAMLACGALSVSLLRFTRRRPCPALFPLSSPCLV